MIVNGRVYQRIWTYEGRKRKAWAVDYVLNGRRVRKTIGPRKAEAEEYLQQVRLGKLGHVREVTLAEAAPWYIAGKRAKGRRSPDRYERSLRMLRRFYGDGKVLNEITAGDVEEFKRWRLTQGKEPATVNRDLACLKNLLREAKRQGWVAEVPEIVLEKEPEGRLRFLTEDEEECLLAACRTGHKVPADLHPIVLMALNTGMRVEEICTLRRSQVDLKRRQITLRKTKSGKRRMIPINDTLLGMLRARPPRIDTDLVFPGREHGGQCFRSAFESACKRAKLEDFTFHDLRHTFASRLVMRGASLKAVQELLGHSSLNMVMRYAHLAPGHLHDTVALLDGTRQAQQETPLATGSAK